MNRTAFMLMALIVSATSAMEEDAKKLSVGIDELGEKTRKMCFAPPGKDRPTEFASKPGSEILLVTFERDKSR